MKSPSGSTKSTRSLVILVVILASATWWSFGYLAEQSQRFTAAHRDMKKSQHLTQSIRNLRVDTKSSSHELEIEELTKRIETAARHAELPLSQLVRIWPEPPRRIADSYMQEKPTQILLRSVTLKQWTHFAWRLTQEDDRLTIRSLRLTAPRDQSSPNQWNVDATVIQITSAPAIKKQANKR